MRETEGMRGRERRDVRVTAQRPLDTRRQWEGREDSRASECGRGLPAAFVAVADVDREGLGEGRLEGDGAALAGRVHIWDLSVAFKEGEEREVKRLKVVLGEGKRGRGEGGRR
jgi:hypothetical protein